jgi:UDP-GlcNAc:undecaprenyl-phosphate/decaprenyl-phosphate GlcNAc-1-phosphate transferase
MPVKAQLLIVFTAALVGALIFVPLAAATGMAVGGALVDRPRPGEMQRRPISRTGGYGIIAAFFAALVVSLPFILKAQDRFLSEYGVTYALPKVLAENSRLIGLTLGAAFLVPFAAWDDWKRLPPLPQLIAQLGCAAIPIAFGVRMTSVSNPFPVGGDQILLGLFVVPVTLVWIVGMINALNWLDTSDGLAGGVSMISALVLVAASLVKRTGFKEPQYTIAFLPLILAGVCLGFLVFNFPPARLFMGTGGSMFLGYALGVVSIIGGAKIATAVLVLGFPILDAALVIIRRLAAGRSPMQGGDDAHLVHQLRKAGLSVRQIALLLYGLTALFGALSISLFKEQKFFAFAAVICAIGALIVFLRRRGTLVPSPAEQHSEA